MTTCYVTSRSCWLGLLMGDPSHVGAYANRLYQVAHKFGFKNFEFAGKYFESWVKFMKGEDRRQAVEAMQRVYEAYYVTKTILNRTAFLVFFAQVCLMASQRARGLKAIEESIQLGEETGELWFQAEAWRTKGELLLMRTEKGQAQIQAAQTCFETALQIAREQGAKAFELRVAISLARLWQGQARTADALHVLDQVYSGFTEGFETADLQEARRLIEAMNYKSQIISKDD